MTPPKDQTKAHMGEYRHLPGWCTSLKKGAATLLDANTARLCPSVIIHIPLSNSRYVQFTYFTVYHLQSVADM